MPEIETIVLDNGKSYSVIKMEGLSNSFETGEPELPEKFIRLIIPSDKEVSKINLNLNDKTVFNIEHLIHPVQKQRHAFAEIEKGFIEPDNNIYGSSKPYPREIAKVVNHGFYDGNHIVTISIIPFQYYPLIHKLEFIQTITLTLSMEKSFEQSYRPKKRLQRNQKIYDANLLNLVYNPEDIATYQIKPSLIQPVLNKVSESALEHYEYVVITSNFLKCYFNPLCELNKHMLNFTNISYIIF